MQSCYFLHVSINPCLYGSTRLGQDTCSHSLVTQEQRLPLGQLSTSHKGYVKMHSYPFSVEDPGVAVASLQRRTLCVVLKGHLAHCCREATTCCSGGQNSLQVSTNQSLGELLQAGALRLYNQVPFVLHCLTSCMPARLLQNLKSKEVMRMRTLSGKKTARQHWFSV